MGAASAEEVVGKTDFDYYPRELAAQYDADDQAVMRSGQPLINREEPLTDAAGGQHWLLTTKVPWRDPDGQVIGLIGIGHDITGRKRAEESLKLFRTLIDRSSDAIQVVNPENGRFLDANEQAYVGLGYSREEFLSLTVFDVDPTVERSAYPKIIEELRKSGYMSWEGYNQRKDGSRFPVEVNQRNIQLDRSYVVSVVRDITERNQREREMQAIAAVSAALRTAPNRAEMLPVILDQLLALLNADGAVLAMRDPATGDTVFEMARGAWASVAGHRLPPGAGMCGQVIATGQPYVNNDAQNDLRFSQQELFGALRTVAGVPLVAQQQVIGALRVGRNGPFAGVEVRLLTAIADIAANAIHRATLHEQTERSVQRLTALRTIDTAITSSLDLRVTLSTLLDQVASQLRVDAAAVLRFSPPLQMLEYASGRGFRTNAITRSRLRLGEGHTGRAALERRLVSVPDLRQAASAFERAQLLAGEGFIAYHAAPLIAKGKLKGVLEVFHRAPLSPAPDWLDFLETLAGQAAIAVDDAELFDSLQRSNAELVNAYDATIEGWSRALDLRDKETEGHTQRVAELTLRLAQAMGLSEAELVHVRRGALLHDIGKMGVPDHVLLKPGPLTDDEWAMMRRHPAYAYEMLAPIVYLKPALDIPYCHHEKWDGTGYPRRLKGDEIPLAARLFAVVDVWDALRADRPYRAAWPHEKVLEHIRSQAGTHFDPQVVDVFLSVLVSS